MAEEIEISAVDTRYESYRVRDPSAERAILARMGERGIEEPLCGVGDSTRMVLLDGFKRYRCAKRLHLGLVPWESVGVDEAEGILSVLKPAERRPLGILEEAEFLRALQGAHGMSLGAIAAALSRSRSWVCMRLNLLDGMGARVRERIFAGSFPAYAYMHIVRPFMRMNGVSAAAIESFVEAVSGQNLTVREIERLAHGYFRGPATLREEIEAGHHALALGQMRRVEAELGGMSERERAYVGELRRVARSLQSLSAGASDVGLSSGAFCAEAHLVLTEVLGRVGGYVQALRRIHDRCGSAQERGSPARRGAECAGDRPSSATQPADGAGDHRAEGADAASVSDGEGSDRSGASPASVRGVRGAAAACT
jgi:hypothetical protein